ncbi:type I methionyl aminopeptidase [Candidatus Saccharibacteria bacterium]|nr:type I methionyl aminopeptidase [Candidatus Saccharibacteria bacterium]
MKAKSPTEIESMRQGGRKLAAILNMLAGKVTPGATPKDISRLALSQIKKEGMQPVVLGYQGFPDVMCVSVNEAIVHGVPQGKSFKSGDVVKLDLTLGFQGLVVDSALTVIVGEGSADSRRLVEGTRKALHEGISAISGDGTRIGDIGSAIQNCLQKNKLGIIRDLVGHGVGYGIHEDPNIPNYGVAGTGSTLFTGMTIAIEPMASLGDWHVSSLKDGTVVMADGSLGAHFEHTVLITDDGAEILTLI